MIIIFLFFILVKEAEKAKKKKAISTNNSPINGNHTSRIKNKSFTALKSNKEVSRENKAPAPKLIEAQKDLQSPKTCVSRQKNLKISGPAMKFRSLKKNIPTPRYNKSQNPKESLNSRKRFATKKSTCTDNQPTKDANGNDNELSDEKNKESDPYKQIKVKEHSIVDLMNKNQPHHDHCYTTIYGKKRPLGTAHKDDDDSEEDPDDQNKNIQKRPRKIQPILDLGAKCENGYMVAQEQIVDSDGNPNDLQSDDESCKFSSLHKFVHVVRIILLFQQKQNLLLDI